MLPPGPERAGRGRLARPDQGALRDSRHARAADHRQDRKPWLHPDDQLGRDAAGADDEAGLHRRCSRHRSACPKIVATAVVTRGADQRLLDLVLSAPCRSASRTIERGRRRRDGRAGRAPPVAVAEGLEVGPAGPRHPGRRGEGRASSPTPSTQARGRRRRRARRDRHHGAEGTPVIAAAPGRSRNCSTACGGGITVYVRSADRTLDLLLRPSVGLCAGSRRGAAGEARPGDRPRRPYRRRQRRRAAPPFRDQPHGAGRAMVATARRSIPTRCLPGKRPAARALPPGSFPSHSDQVGDP